MNWKTVIAVGAILFSGILYAHTPDGETPANEEICDELKGSTPGLYGLCVAYCEAQDSDTTGDTKANLLNNYNKKMIEGVDPTMPCLAPPPEPYCPCFTYQEVAAIAETQSISSAFWCFNGPEGGTNFYQAIQSTVGIPWDPFEERDAHTIESGWEEGFLRCDYRDYLWDGESAIESLSEWEVEVNAENRILYQACVDIMDAVFATYPLNCN
jgi:hypothetical protein